MPCFSCICFRDGRGRNGEPLNGGRGYCKLRDQEYYRGHECKDFAPVWHSPSNKGDPLKEPSSCFLTSACVEYLGLPDDCGELSALRQFRDGVLKASPEGAALVEEYYRIAPALVERINGSVHKKEIYNGIYRQILLCIRAIEAQNHSEAIRIYREMVENISATV